jgi:O-antigen/teichoic acid export membrane protein
LNTVRRNLAANLVGTGWNAVLSILFIPVYLRLLGVEAYALIGFYAVLLTIFGLLDLGLGATLNRRIASQSVTRGPEADERHLLRTFELIYFGLALSAAVVLFASASFIAHRWIHVHELPMRRVISAIRLMGVLFAFQFPFALYQAGLLGLQRHVLFNAIAIVGSTLRSVGAVAVLMFVSPSIVAFFGWQVIAMMFMTGSVAWAMWRAVGRARQARFDLQILRSEWVFAASVAANSLLAAFIAQADKAILSSVAPLKDLGYYTIAASLSAGLWTIIVPINSAVYPRFSQLLAMHDEAAVADVFHKACQTIALFVLPIGVTLIVFARLAIFTWTGNAAAADNGALIAPLLVTGTVMYGLYSVPAYLQFAAGWPQLTLYTNVVTAAILLPFTFIAVRLFGPPGAALLWLLVNSAYVIPATIMFRRVMTTERRRWYLRDLGLPTLAAASAGVLLRLCEPADMSRLLAGFYLLISAAVIFGAVFVVVPDVRRVVTLRLRTLILRDSPA